MITTHIHRIKYIPLLSLCLLTSSFSSCQNAPQTNQIQLSSVSENRSIPLEEIIRIKTPGVFVGRTVQELNNNIRKEFPNLSVSEENFKTQQSSFSSTSFTPDQINVINLANGDIRFKVLTKSIYTEVNILGESGDTVSFFVFYKGPSASPLVSLPPSDPFSPQPNYRDLLLPPDPTSEVEVGGVLPEAVEIEIEWIPLMVKWLAPCVSIVVASLENDNI